MSKQSTVGAPDTPQVTKSEISHVLLNCDSAVLPGGPAFCAEISQSLQAQGLRVTPYAGQAAHDLGPEHVVLEAKDLKRTKAGLSLRLAWIYGATGQTGQTEIAGLRVMDAALTATAYGPFIKGLIDPKILPFLK